MKAKNNDFIVALTAYLTGYLILATIRIGGYQAWFVNTAWDYALSIFLQFGVMFVLPTLAFILYKKYSRPKGQNAMTFTQFEEYQASLDKRSIFQKWGFGKISWGVVGIAIGLGVMLFFFNMAMSSVFNGIIGLVGYRHMSEPTAPEYSATFGGWGVLMSLFMSAVLPGLCEETTHRGMLMQTFRERIGIIRAMTLSSLMFALFHMNVEQVFYTAILGYFMAMSAVTTRSIWTAVIIHFMNNGLIAYISYAETYGWFGGNFFDIYTTIFFDQPFSFILYIAFIIGIYYGVVNIFRYCARKNFLKDEKERLAQGLQPNPDPVHFKGMNAVKYYVSVNEPAPQVRFLSELRPLEKTLLYGVLFLGFVLTGMSFVWGFL